jgi:hypothetical protein
MAGMKRCISRRVVSAHHFGPHVSIVVVQAHAGGQLMRRLAKNDGTRFDGLS